MLKVFAVAALLALATPAIAGTQNLDKAVADAFSAYGKGGSDALVTAAKICNSGIDTASGSHDMTPGEQAEYCFGFEIASMTIINKEPGAARPQDPNYFRPDNVLLRASINLEHTRVISLPEQVTPYIVPRVDYITSLVNKRL